MGLISTRYLHSTHDLNLDAALRSEERAKAGMAAQAKLAQQFTLSNSLDPDCSSKAHGYAVGLYVLPDAGMNVQIERFTGGRHTQRNNWHAA